MPSSPVLFHSGLGFIAAISLLALVAPFLPLIASPLLLWRYRRTVARLMAAQAGEAERGGAGGAQTRRDAALSLRAFDAAEADPASSSRESHLGDRLYRRIIAGRR